MYLKWAGGKTGLASKLISFFPAECKGKYIEPFFGSGAMYFALRQTHTEPDIFNDTRFSPISYIGSDVNEQLMNCHLVVKHRVDDLEKALQEKKQKHSESPSAFYDAERQLVTEDVDFSKGCDVESAARFIYINKTCFNGLWRVNKSGLFNVPWNKKETVNLVSGNKLRSAHHYLQSCELNICQYEQSCNRAEAGDLVYLDPPYVPLSDTSSFTAYTEEGFSEQQLWHLKAVCDAMDARGVYWCMSNSTAQAVYEAFSDYHIRTIKAHRLIKRIKEKENRNKVYETVIRNYG